MQLASVAAPPRAMGSVSETYRCPWCGRVGNGGYAFDGINDGLICTRGAYSCMQRILADRTVRPVTIMLRQLGAIFRPAPLPEVCMTRVAEFLLDPRLGRHHYT